ncbi:LysR family transcriptional regulator ArgP [Nocardioides sp. GXQ0305]|uniref:LysR family transcriptional regulator ArgP n=1 Tax=Nocardioides sp. GXQ0305 TaxID=3423912 RepID=UPI003D7DC86D
MELPPSHLSTLLAIVEHGTFDAAARALDLTPSAVSQRVRALEVAVGRVVVQRTTPCLPTAAGEVLLRLARQQALLARETARELGGSQVTVELAVGVNADSLATWFADVLAEAATWDDVALRVSVEDQAWSSDLLRRGDVLGVVTSDPTPVQGCRVTPLGAMRYRPAAAPALAERWRRGRGHDWERMPVVVVNEKDALQHDVLTSRGVAPALVHRVPTSHDFLAAVRAGLGWGMLPEQQLSPGLADGSLVRLPGGHVDVPLHWMRWRLASPALDRLGDAVATAATALRRVRQG